MAKTELRELIANGRGSGVELKKQTLGNQEFAKEIGAFANFRGGWNSLLVNTRFLYDSDRRPATVAGLMLFGKAAIRFLPHTKISAIAYSGSEKDCAPRERRSLHGPIVTLNGADGTLREPGLIEQAVEFVGKNTGTPASEYRARKRKPRNYPELPGRDGLGGGRQCGRSP